MLHHLSLPVSNIERAGRFYDGVLGALGFQRVAENAEFVGYGTETGKDKFALMQTSPVTAATRGFHIAFTARSKSDVDEFHKQALLLGGADNGEAGLRPHYGDNYYAAFVADLDGHHLEAVYKPTQT